MAAADEAYRAQVRLLLDVLPIIAEEKDLALKGAAAINLFVRNLPRLSVDIDLTYLPMDGRDAAIANISAALLRIKTGSILRGRNAARRLLIRAMALRSNFKYRG